MEPIFRIATFVTLAVGVSGCGAARGTYFLVDAEQRLQDAREQGAPEAVYQWTMAEEHMKKAYEEWGYSDYEAAERMAGLATKAGVEGRALAIHTPLIDLSKAAIIRLGLSLGLDYRLTHSCYDPLADGRPCGHCDSCRLRAAGFADAGAIDPLIQPPR